METQDKGKSFGMLFLIMWGGAFVVTINTKLLGGHISFFQCVCVLGYCVFPIVLASVAIYVFKIMGIHLLILKIIVSGVALVWSTFSTHPWYSGSISFMNVLIEDDKKFIATYPIFLFYLFIDWFTLFIWCTKLVIKLWPIYINMSFAPRRSSWKTKIAPTCWSSRRCSHPPGSRTQRFRIHPLPLLSAPRTCSRFAGFNCWWFPHCRPRRFGWRFH